MGAVARAVESAVSSVGRAVGQAVKDVGHAVEQTVKEVGKGVERVGQEIGEAGKNFDSFVRREIPGGWVTVGAVALTVATAGAAGALSASAASAEAAAISAEISAGVASGTFTAAEAAAMTAALEASYTTMGSAAMSAIGSTMSTMGTGALLGGGVGAAMAGINGTDVLKGAFNGAVMGGASAGLASGFGQLATAVMNASDVAISSAAASKIGNALAVGTRALATGADPATVATNFAINTGLGELGKLADLGGVIDNRTIGNMVTNAINSAAKAAITGKDPGTAAMFGAISSGVSSAVAGGYNTLKDYAKSASEMFRDTKVNIATAKSELANYYDNYQKQEADAATSANNLFGEVKSQFEADKLANENAVAQFNDYRDTVLQTQAAAEQQAAEIDTLQKEYNDNKAAYEADNSNTAAYDAANAAADKLNTLIPEYNKTISDFESQVATLTSLKDNAIATQTVVEESTKTLISAADAIKAFNSGDIEAAKTAFSSLSGKVGEDSLSGIQNALDSMGGAKTSIVDTATKLDTETAKATEALTKVVQASDVVNVQQNAASNLVFDKATGDWKFDQAAFDKQRDQIFNQILAEATPNKTAEELAGMMKNVDPSTGQTQYIDENFNIYDANGKLDYAPSTNWQTAFAGGDKYAQTNVTIYGSAWIPTMTDAVTGGTSDTSQNQSGAPLIDDKTLNLANRYVALSPEARQQYENIVADGGDASQAMQYVEQQAILPADTAVAEEAINVLTQEQALESLSTLDEQIAAMEASNASLAAVDAMKAVRNNMFASLYGGAGVGTGAGTGTDLTGSGPSSGGSTNGPTTTPTTTPGTTTSTDTSTTTTPPADTTTTTGTPTGTTGTSTSGGTSGGTGGGGTGTPIGTAGTQATKTGTTPRPWEWAATAAKDPLTANVVGGTSKIDLGGQFTSPQTYSVTMNPYTSASPYQAVFAASGGSTTALRSATSGDQTGAANIIGGLSDGAINLGGEFSPAQIYAVNQMLNQQQGMQNYAGGGGVDYTPQIIQGDTEIRLGHKTPKFKYLHGGLPQVPSQTYAEGGHVPEFYSEGGLANRYVQGDGDGTSDDVPAMLATGEFVIPADVVSSLGNGSNEAGSNVLDELLQVIRSHKQNHNPKELPPDSLGPLAYLDKAMKKAGK